MMAGTEPLAEAANRRAAEELRASADIAARCAEEARGVAEALRRVQHRVVTRLDEPIARHVEHTWHSGAAAESRARLSSDAAFAVWAAVVSLAATAAALEEHASTLEATARRQRGDADDLVASRLDEAVG